MTETTKERQNRLQLTKAEQSTKGSEFYKFTPCNGTMVNAGFDEDKKQIQKVINYRINKAERVINSTKLGNDKSLRKKTHRTNRYEPQMLTVLLVMRMTKKQREGIEIDRYYAFRAK